MDLTIDPVIAIATAATTATPELPTDYSKSLISVQTTLYKDVNSILLEIYGPELVIVCRQFKIQNIIQKHFIAMRNDLNKEIRRAINEAVDARKGKSKWKRFFGFKSGPEKTS